MHCPVQVWTWIDPHTAPENQGSTSRARKETRRVGKWHGATDFWKGMHRSPDAEAKTNEAGVLIEELGDRRSWGNRA